LGIEFYNQVSNLDAIVIPCSGGGMLSGVAIALNHLNSKIRM
jgi:threonine dehydratase